MSKSTGYPGVREIEIATTLFVEDEIDLALEDVPSYEEVDESITNAVADAAGDVEFATIAKYGTV